LPPPPSQDDDECVSSKEHRNMIKAMTELFMKNQKSTDISLERVGCSIAGTIDRVDILESQLPPLDNAKPIEEIPEDYNEV
jgi:hypothetical protein